MSITIILIMIYTNLRLAEIMRSKIDTSQIKDGKIIIETMILKKPAGPVKIILRKME
jgi:hypothetical protein